MVRRIIINLKESELERERERERERRGSMKEMTILAEKTLEDPLDEMIMQMLLKRVSE